MRVARNMEREKIFVWANGKGYHYNFACLNCDREYELVAGEGRTRSLEIKYNGLGKY